MAEIVNLRRARKAKARQDAATTAAANRLTFGQSKAHKTAKAVETAHTEKALDRHQLDTLPNKPQR
jgi:hypothetical protein